MPNMYDKYGNRVGHYDDNTVYDRYGNRIGHYEQESQQMGGTAGSFGGSTGGVVGVVVVLAILLSVGVLVGIAWLTWKFPKVMLPVLVACGVGITILGVSISHNNAQLLAKEMTTCRHANGVWTTLKDKDDPMYHNDPKDTCIVVYHGNHYSMSWDSNGNPASTTPTTSFTGGLIVCSGPWHEDTKICENQWFPPGT